MSVFIRDETRIAPEGTNAASTTLQETTIDAAISAISPENSAFNRSSVIRLENTDSQNSSFESNTCDRNQNTSQQPEGIDASDSTGSTRKTDVPIHPSAERLAYNSNLPAQSTDGDTSIQPKPNLRMDTEKRHADNININTNTTTNIASAATQQLSEEMSTQGAVAESYRREFEDLLERDEKGEPINEARLYFLELYARRMVGEQLDGDEMRDLEEFENNESHRLMFTPEDDIDTTYITEAKEEEKEHDHLNPNEQQQGTYDKTAGELPTMSAATCTLAKSLMQQILEDSVNSLDPSQPPSIAKKIQSNSNMYEIDPPYRIENWELDHGEKDVKSGSVLRNVDASLYRLKRGTALNTKNIRQDYNADKHKLHNFPKPNGAISKSENFLTKLNGLQPRRPKMSDQAVLIAHAGTKLQNLQKGNRRNPANGGTAQYESRRKERRRQKRQPSSVIAKAGPRRKVPVTQFETRKAEHVAGTSSKRRMGEKAKPNSFTRKPIRNKHGSLQQHARRPESPSTYKNRREFAHLILNQAFSNPIEQLAAVRRTDGTALSRESRLQHPAVSSSEHNSQLSSKSTQATSQKSLVVPSQPIVDKDARKNKNSRHAMQEKVVDRSLHFLSQLNQVKPQSKNSSTSDSIPAGTPQKGDGMSKAISILQQTGVNLSTKHKKIYSSVRNERFLMATDLAYYRIVRENHRLELLFSIAEWRHVHVLMLYARVFRCELLAESIDQPKEFSIYLPDNLQILEPLGVVLASIGVVEDREGGVSYIPVAKPLKGREYKPHDPSDVTMFMEWSQYKWNASWTQVKVERKRRKNNAQSGGIEIPEPEKASSKQPKLRCWEHIAVEMWLGWDEELWFNYELFVESVRRSFLFVDFPRCPAGTYAWLIPSYRSSSGSYAKIPNPAIGNAVWMISLLFDLSDLPPQTTASWFCKTDTITDIQATLLQFLDSAAKD